MVRDLAKRQYLCVLNSASTVHFSSVHIGIPSTDYGVPITVIKVAYNSGMFDNSHLLIMQYFFWNDL